MHSAKCKRVDRRRVHPDDVHTAGPHSTNSRSESLRPLGMPDPRIMSKHCLVGDQQHSHSLTLADLTPITVRLAHGWEPLCDTPVNGLDASSSGTDCRRRSL